ncbi:entericidin EcnAB [Vibrio sp. RC27]
MKITLVTLAMAMLLTGCAETLKGVKKDSSTIWEQTKTTTGEVVDGTREAIHNATE